MYFLRIFILFVLSIFFTGCTALDNISAGISEKSISGGGTLVKQKIGLDETTQTPVMSNLIVVGDYTSAVSGDEVLRYEVIEDCSIFNTNAKTNTKRLLYISSDKERVEKMLNELKEDFNSEEDYEDNNNNGK